MRILLCTGLLLSLFSVGAPLQCMTCLYLYNNTCLMRQARKCSEDTCREVALQSNIFAEDNLSLTYSDCANTQDCIPGTFSISGGTPRFFRMQAECCNTDVCNENPIQLQPESFGPLQCPFCFTKNANDCVVIDTHNCPIGETKCITFAGFMQQAGTSQVWAAFKGCATPDFCNFITTLPTGVRRRLNVLLRFNVTQATCVDAQPSSYTSGL
ncbi:Hypothetical predicted protein [Podarcis lilfordi]|uniref:UPAR/Ly6 domain-containing protein n=1 Tax=Podarcis lilfordi TaxID=74358 RepID=A0AA35KMU1_9SAUR|nr:Hypothetical predicted protein [Podarcis lilfordi]